MSQPTATEADLAACFRLLLGREPGAEEWLGHCSLVGQPLAAVVSSYLNSAEHARLVGRGASPLAGLRLVPQDGYALYAAEDDLAVGRHVALGAYEPEVAATLREHLRPGMVAVDIGANIGVFTMLAAHLVGPAGHVLAVEPNPENIRLIEASRRENGFAQVAIAGCAVGREVGLLALESVYSNGTTTDPAADLAALFETRLVPSLPLSRILPERPLDFIKIDIEGAEYTALSGVTERLRQERPVIVSEFSPTLLPANSGVPAPEYLRLLTGLGYRLAVIKPGGAIPCDTPAAVMALYDTCGGDHVDLLLTPAPATPWWARRPGA